MSSNQHLWLPKIVSWMDCMQAHGVMVMDGLHASPRCDGHGWIACKPWCDGHGCMYEIHGVMVMDTCMQAIVWWSWMHACKPWCDGHGWIACMMEPCLPAWHRSLSLCHMLVRGKREEGREMERREREREIRVKTSALIALLLYLFRWVPSLQEFSLGMLFVTNLQRGHVHLSCFSLVDDGLPSVFLSWVFLFCSLISCCCCCWWVGCRKLGFRKKWVLRKSWGFWCSLLYLSKRFEFGAWSLLLLFLLLSLDFLQNCQICCIGWWISFCLFLFCFSVFVWMGWRWRAWKIWTQ